MTNPRLDGKSRSASCSLQTYAVYRKPRLEESSSSRTFPHELKVGRRAAAPWYATVPCQVASLSLLCASVPCSCTTVLVVLVVGIAPAVDRAGVHVSPLLRPSSRHLRLRERLASRSPSARRNPQDAKDARLSQRAAVLASDRPDASPARSSTPAIWDNRALL